MNVDRKQLYEAIRTLNRQVDKRGGKNNRAPNSPTQPQLEHARYALVQSLPGKRAALALTVWDKQNHSHTQIVPAIDWHPYDQAEAYSIWINFYVLWETVKLSDKDKSISIAFDNEYLDFKRVSYYSPRPTRQSGYTNTLTIAQPGYKSRFVAEPLPDYLPAA